MRKKRALKKTKPEMITISDRNFKMTHLWMSQEIALSLAEVFKASGDSKHYEEAMKAARKFANQKDDLFYQGESA